MRRKMSQRGKREQDESTLQLGQVGSLFNHSWQRFGILKANEEYLITYYCREQLHFQIEVWYFYSYNFYFLKLVKKFSKKKRIRKLTIKYTFEQGLKIKYQMPNILLFYLPRLYDSWHFIVNIVTQKVKNVFFSFLMKCSANVDNGPRESWLHFDDCVRFWSNVDIWWGSHLCFYYCLYTVCYTTGVTTCRAMSCLAQVCAIRVMYFFVIMVIIIMWLMYSLF